MSGSGTVKCLMWDLDGTLWDGVLAEGDAVQPRPSAIRTIRTLDERGILHSVASRNDAPHALEKLREFGIGEYFLHPRIHWESKVNSLRGISESLRIGLDSLAFIDDDPVEREEVRRFLPDVLCLDASEVETLSTRPEFVPPVSSEDASRRRAMYREDISRTRVEGQFPGTREEFLATLDMVFTIFVPGEADLRRAEELTLRTNQLNTTGRSYSIEELNRYRSSPNHRLLLASLEDRFGSYGRIGLALVECRPAEWTLRLLLMSCRVLSRGVGTILLSYVMKRSQESGARLRAEFVPNERNRSMNVTLRFAGFRDSDTLHLLEWDSDLVPPPPSYVKVRYGPGLD